MNFEQKKNTKAIIWTVGIHVLLLLLFLMCKYTMPVQAKTEDLGMEVNLGTSDNGSGTDQPEQMDDPAAANAAVATNAAAASSNNDKEINTTEDDAAPVVDVRKPKPNTKPSPKQPVTESNKKGIVQNNTAAAKKAPAQSPRYVYTGSTGKGGNGAQQNKPGTSEGIGTGNGDMGVPHGTPGASNYTGTPGAGGGSSMSVSITDRSLVSRPDPKAEFREGGQVVIRVTVNRDGAITSSRVMSAANATIRGLALQKMASVRFNKSASAPVEERCNITFDFRTTRK
jgi:outer membrane biosynthesis protein TonB